MNKKFNLVNKLLPALMKMMVVTFIFSMRPAMALQVPWNDVAYSHYSENESLSDVIAALMTSQGIAVHTSPSITSKVNLDFRSIQPPVFFRQLITAYQLTWYYDGQMLYVYNMDEINTGSLQLKHITASVFSESLLELGILDSRFSWRKSKDEKLVYFSGPERFTKVVMEMAMALDTKPVKEKKKYHRKKPTVYRWEDEEGVIRFSSKKPGTQPSHVIKRHLKKPPKMIRKTRLKEHMAVKKIEVTQVIN